MKTNDKKIRVDVYAHDWGFLIPCKSGVVWEQQTSGIICDHVYVEGVFIPLCRPYEVGEGHRKRSKLLDLLERANYHHKPTEKIWERIKKSMHFDFEVIQDSNLEPPNQEGFIWIKLKKFKSGWGHCKGVEELVGKKLVLIFPNCD